MIVKRMRVTKAERTTATFECVWERQVRRESLVFEYDGRSCAISDAAAIALTPIATFHQENLTLREPVSPGLGSRLAMYARLFATEHRLPFQTAINVREHTAHPPAQGVGLAFSGGVDSIYSLLNLKERNETITAVFATGFDTEFESDTREMRERLRTHLEPRGVTLVHVRTNVKKLIPEPVGYLWTLMAQTTAAAIGMVYAHRYSQFFVPTHAYIDALIDYDQPDLLPSTYGNAFHAFLDQTLLSTPNVVITPHGIESDRSSKVQHIARDELTRSILRVCWNQRELRNCGSCMKCRSTKAAFMAADPHIAREIFPETKVFDTSRIQTCNIEDFSNALRAAIKSRRVRTIARTYYEQSRARAAGLSRTLQGGFY
jgi:hypothetical protein